MVAVVVFISLLCMSVLINNNNNDISQAEKTAGKVLKRVGLGTSEKVVKWGRGSGVGWGGGVGADVSDGV